MNEDSMNVDMFYRQIFINIKNRTIYIGRECNMLKEHARKIEKNCVFGHDNRILKELSENFVTIDHDTKRLYKVSVDTISRIINKYGYDNFQFSLGTPIVKYKGINLMVCHTKIVYTKSYPNTQFEKFMKFIDMGNIMKHGKYIYFMYLVAFTDLYEVVSFSNQFIPTDNNFSHLPYLLVFPSGFTKKDDNYIISYGEGDERSKLLILTEREIDKLMTPINEIDPEKYNFGFYQSNKKKFLTSNRLIKRILIIGYYNQENTGDDGFQVVFQHLINDEKIDFCNPSEFDLGNIDKYSLVIFGGGDIIGPYFTLTIKKIKEISDIKIIAVSVGIPYLNNISEFKYVDEVYLRNPEDVITVKSNFPEKIVMYYPDLCYILPQVYPSLKKFHISAENFNIGVCLARPYYNCNNESTYYNLISNIATVLDCLTEKNIDGKKIKLWLIPFGINKNNEKEHDRIINQHILNSCVNDNISIVEIDNEDNVYDVFSVIGHMDYNICSRFHAHIFSLAHRIPFTSVVTTRKCIELVKNVGLESNLIKLEKNINDFPEILDVEKTFARIYENIKNREESRVNIGKYMDLVNIDIKRFLKTFNYIIEEA